MLNFIKDELQPMRFALKNHFKLYKIIAGVFEQCKNDITMAGNASFPLLCDFSYIADFQSDFGIRRHKIDTDDTLRERVATAANYLERIGERELLEQYLNDFFPQRWELIDASNMCFQFGVSRLGVDAIFMNNSTLRVRIQNLTAHEKEVLDDFLDNFLDADIQYFIQLRK